MADSERYGILRLLFSFLCMKHSCQGPAVTESEIGVPRGNPRGGCPLVRGSGGRSPPEAIGVMRASLTIFTLKIELTISLVNGGVV